MPLESQRLHLCFISSILLCSKTSPQPFSPLSPPSSALHFLLNLSCQHTHMDLCPPALKTSFGPNLPKTFCVLPNATKPRWDVLFVPLLPLVSSQSLARPFVSVSTLPLSLFAGPLGTSGSLSCASSISSSLLCWLLPQPQVHRFFVLGFWNLVSWHLWSFKVAPSSTAIAITLGIVPVSWLPRFITPMVTLLSGTASLSPELFSDLPCLATVYFKKKDS